MRRRQMAKISWRKNCRIKQINKHFEEICEKLFEKFENYFEQEFSKELKKCDDKNEKLESDKAMLLKHILEIKKQNLTN